MYRFLLLLRRAKRSNLLGLHRYINLMYYDTKYVQVRIEDLDYVVVDELKFHISDQINSIQRVKGNSWVANVRPTDIVVDIGANIGAVTIPLAKVAKKVYAVEPLFQEELRRNLVLNNLSNVEIMPYALGSKVGFMDVEYSSKHKIDTPILTFEDVKEYVGKQIDFLKIDGEGCEWNIDPKMLDGIRELRIEFHIRRGSVRQDKATLMEWYKWLDSKDYKYVVTNRKDSFMVPFTACILLEASKRTGGGS